MHVEAVHLQDSLQALAKLPEAERLAIIDKKIEEVKKEEEEAKALAEKEAYLAEQEAKGTGIDRPGTENQRCCFAERVRWSLLSISIILRP